MTNQPMKYTRLLLSIWLVVLCPNAVAQNTTTDPNSIQYVEFQVQLDDTTTDSFVVEVHPEWAPLGAARFLELVDTTVPAPFYNDVRFFRVLEEFIAQFGINGDPAVAQEWQQNKIMDDPVVETNTYGTLSFATAGANTRTTQIFVNTKDNTFLDNSGFAPFAKISPQGMAVVEQLYAGYGEGAPDGNGPSQESIQNEGNTYLEQDFPLLSYVLSASRVDNPGGTSTITTMPIGVAEEEGDQTSDTEEESPPTPATNSEEAPSAAVCGIGDGVHIALLGLAGLCFQACL